MNLTDIRTASGKTIQDFTIPKALLENDVELVEMVLLSGSMNDGEKQYWFNLTEVMNPEQLQKLRDILLREKRKIAEIKAKYDKESEDPAQALARAEEKGIRRSEEQQRIAEQEQIQENQEKSEEEAVLQELNQV